ncbi:hypothetical protein [Pseudomonas abietaniphila]|nr:hypothetical protein [Pseudomonas abietaniphila]
MRQISEVNGPDLTPAPANRLLQIEARRSGQLDVYVKVAVR